jgi:hypothetical protein
MNHWIRRSCELSDKNVFASLKMEMLQDTTQNSHGSPNRPPGISINGRQLQAFIAVHNPAFAWLNIFFSSGSKWAFALQSRYARAPSRLPVAFKIRP